MNKTLILGAIVMITLGTTAIVATIMLQQQSALSAVETGPAIVSPRMKGEALSMLTGSEIIDERKAPIATSDDNTYITWWTNRTGNDEVMFRASTDNGATFTDKINLSNTTHLGRLAITNGTLTNH